MFVVAKYFEVCNTEVCVWKAESKGGARRLLGDMSGGLFEPGPVLPGNIFPKHRELGCDEGGGTGRSNSRINRMREQETREGIMFLSMVVVHPIQWMLSSINSEPVQNYKSKISSVISDGSTFHVLREISRSKEYSRVGTIFKSNTHSKIMVKLINGVSSSERWKRNSDEVSASSAQE